MEIKHFEKIGGHGKIIEFLYKAALELPRAAAGMDVPPINHDQGAVVAFNSGNRVIGAIAYDRQEWCKTFWVTIGYVAPPARRAGLYRKLWERLVEEARAKEVLKISGGTAVGNTAMQAVMTRLGREQAYIVYDFKVPEVAA